jgi:thymidine phosphorylase
LPKAKYSAPVPPGEEGYLSSINTRRIGMAIVDLGGGRQRVDDTLDLSVGYTDIARSGAKVGKDQPLAIAHAASEEALQQAVKAYAGACVISESKPENRPLIYESIC